MISKIKTFFLTKIKPHLPTICFICGSTWDTLTLRRIDSWWDLTVFSTYLFLSGIVVTLIGRKVTFKFSEYLPSVAQFFFGGLFSACTVYYFKSTSSWPTIIFFFGIVCLLVGNEFLEKKYKSSTQIVFTFWTICCFMILNFLIPVLSHSMGHITFILTVIAAFSLALLIKFLAKNSALSIIPTLSVYILLVGFYFLDIIPPVPLSQKHLGMYYSVQRKDGQFYGTIAEPKWYEPFKKSEQTLFYSPGDAIYCFGSIFAPTKLKKKIYHHWFYKDPKTNKYVHRGAFGYNLVGGRDKGFRGYTFKRNIQPGAWKVAMKTEDGRTVGVTHFKILKADSVHTIHNVKQLPL